MNSSLTAVLPGSLQRRIIILNSRIARVQIALDGNFSDSGLNRYGFIDDNAVVDESAKSPEIGFDCCPDSPGFTVKNSGGETILHVSDAGISSFGSTVTLKAAPDEDWIGFGDQTRERLFHRGHVADCHMRNVRSYIPVPFFMSTRGVGILVNTTYRTRFDMCKSDPDQVVWRDGRGTIDFYIFAGNSFRELIDLYTSLTGRPKLPPEWSFGLWYICRTQANDYEAVNDALNFRREGIPCDVIGLEPGWMQEFYDETTDKEWSKERFPIPKYARLGPHNFINAIQRMGFKLELWLCCDYDLSYEAERRIGQDPVKRSLEQESFFDPEAEKDQHLLQPRLADKVTKPEEPWFEHLKKFVDQGAAFFKQDGAFQVLEHPDRLWGNGMADAEMHNLYPLLYVRQMLEGFEEYTERRGLTFTPSGWIGFQAWAGTWTGDTGGRLPTLGALLNTAALGHSWMTNDMEAVEKEGIHFGYLLPWSQINSWTYFRMPWVQGDELLGMHKYYSRLRAKLIPYLYSWAWYATRTGYPLLVPLPIEFQEDRQCRDVMHQYLLGRDLMVTVYKKETYFPAGRWKDFWSGTIHEGGTHHEIAWPDDRGGGLFVREGALIPFGPVMQYRQEKPLDRMELYVFPGSQESWIDFYEDDGTSLKHREGAFSVTRITALRKDGAVIVSIAASQGSFEGQVAERCWSFRVALDSCPHKVSVNGSQLSAGEWSFDETRGELAIAEQCGRANLIVEVIV